MGARGLCVLKHVIAMRFRCLGTTTRFNFMALCETRTTFQTLCAQTCLFTALSDMLLPRWRNASPAHSICYLFPRIREQGPTSDQNQNSCTESRNHNTALTCLQNNNNISHVHCASLLQYKHTEGNLNYKLNCS